MRSLQSVFMPQPVSQARQNISTNSSLKPPPLFSDRPKQGGGFKLLDTDLKKIPAPSAPDIIMNYQHYVIFLLSAAPQAKILPFLMRFTTDFALKIAFPKANNSQDPQNFLRPRSQIRPKQGGGGLKEGGV